jgi:hypothetical protein
MSTIHVHQTTTSTPEQFLAALIDFGPGRSKLFGNSADGYLKVHHRGPFDADVTEGSGGVWERLHYDWSDPTRVVMTTATPSRPSKPGTAKRSKAAFKSGRSDFSRSASVDGEQRNGH